MTIDPRMALQCAETACGAIFSAREYPRARCPLCGSEAVSLAAECPALSVRTLRYWISRADELGLGRAVLRVGRKVLVDVEQFERWLSVL